MYVQGGYIGGQWWEGKKRTDTTLMSLNDVIKYERTIEDKWFFLSVFPRRQKSDYNAYPRLTSKTAGEKNGEKRRKKKATL